MSTCAQVTAAIVAVLTIAAAAPRTQAETTAYERLCAGHKVAARIGQAPSGKTMLLVDRQPQPLFLLEGQNLSAHTRPALIQWPALQRGR